MKVVVKWLALGLAAATCTAGGYWCGSRHAPTEQAKPDDTAAADDAKPLVAVRVQPIVEGTLAATVTAYGPVLAQPSDVTVMSVPFESRVGHMLITPGQEVAAGDILGEIAPSPDTVLQLRTAQAALAAAQQDFANTQRRFNDHLATNSELLTSQQNLTAAELKLDSLEKNGAGGPQKLQAAAAGIVSKIDVQQGQIVPAGGPLVEIAAGNRIAARLGVEPADAMKLHAGDAVNLTEVRSGSSDSTTGKIMLITRQIDHDTGLVDVLVSFPANAGLVLGGFVRGEFVTATATGLIVPRDAALPESDGFKLFTVENGKAVEHTVTCGLATDRQVIVSGDQLKAGDAVVVTGNYQLEDKMAVTIQTPDSQPTTATAPTTDGRVSTAETRP
jgi:membrane fusion protein, multidrug efflux system